MFGITSMNRVQCVNRISAHGAFVGANSGTRWASSKIQFQKGSTIIHKDVSPTTGLPPKNLKRDDSRKTYLINRYKTLLQDSPIVLFAHHNNLLKNEENQLRSTIKESGGDLHILRNNLFLAYLKAENEEYPSSIEAYERTKKNFHPLQPFLKGPTSMIIIKEQNPSIVGKIIKNLKNANEKLFIIGARVENNVMDLTQVQKFKDLPSKDQLQSELAGLLTILSGAGLVQTLQSASQHLYLSLESHRKNIDPSEKTDEVKEE
ncbi:50S ribosomal protein L10 [Wickerhamomyces ciferrii]|uniref:50S ribosomal protein L10 n=1 Tax=Wickerhamomyces ciferrii (strain ATCC 14091 / BCRC 22168 / CBS 111 / JCM 3599 / NBRC 0793 / NRRL Y-1031 F-60-10) TaxID=1206466 RepID=K0KNF9_WICCF|nr:50S ribosomal protein L10 [Wickerhamomyces ciferrii]CCH42929.1 50S ribosomal protein L10 [Wickerhamomyces ciferrii]